MALIKSISGIRGTIGGRPGENLTPLDIVKFTAAYGSWVKDNNKAGKVVVGRDGRISGSMVQNLVVNTLLGIGVSVIDLGLSTTPTVALGVIWEEADGGIIVSASHNPKEWNALKLLNNKGEFINAVEAEYILKKADEEDVAFASVDKLGSCISNNKTLEKHIEAVLNYPLIDVEEIKKGIIKLCWMLLIQPEPYSSRLC